MRKIFTFIAAALMSAGMWAEPITVTWNNDDISGSGNSFTKDGVTLTCGMNIDWDGKTFLGGGTFTTDLGNFTKIEVTADDCGISGEGWSGSSGQKTWTGNAASVSYSGEIMGVLDGFTFVFTIEELAAEPEPLFEISYEDKWLNIAPADAETPYILWLDSKAFYDGKYTEYTQEKMGGYMDYIVGLVNGANMTDLFLLSGEQKIAPNALLDSQGSSPYSLNDECIAFVFKYDSANKQRASDVEYFVFTYAGEPEQEEGIENIVLTEKAQKVVMDGMIYIVRDGKLFNLTGAQVK